MSSGPQIKGSFRLRLRRPCRREGTEHAESTPAECESELLELITPIS